MSAQVTGIRACGWSDQLKQHSDWWKQCSEAGQLRTRIFFLRLVRPTRVTQKTTPAPASKHARSLRRCGKARRGVYGGAH